MQPPRAEAKNYPTQTQGTLQNVDRLDWQLWILTSLLILVLAAGIISLLYPAVFWSRADLLLQSPENAFYGFCGLIGLTLAYITNKQFKLHEARKLLAQERTRWEQEILFNGMHDQLTGLPNRALLLDRIATCLERAKRRPESHFAVMLLDLDRFKVVNDSLGHSTGDQVLLRVAEKLSCALRNEDTVARLGGDEFGILLESVAKVNEIAHPVERVREALRTPLDIAGHEVFTSASIGVAFSGNRADHVYSQAEDLLRDADSAMYRAKGRGAGQYEIFHPSMHAFSVKMLTMETELRRAIDREELVLHYQPIVALRNDRVYGLEALVRWKHPSGKLVPPGEFLPVAEASGLMFTITNQLLGQAARQLRQWQTERPRCWPLSVTINISPKDFAREDHLAEILSTLMRLKLQAHGIRLEITESQLMEDTAVANRALTMISETGTRVYIDDFGTGYSSLSYLANFTVDALKIDQSFIRSLHEGEKNPAIVRSIISLGQNLGMNVIAEGIETREQRDYLRDANCEFGQGYFFARPMCGEAILGELDKWFPMDQGKEKFVARLRAFPIFAGIDEDDLLELAQISDEVRVPAGTSVVEEGHRADQVYLMEEGRVGIFKRSDEQPHAILDAPDIFGEMSIFALEGSRNATVIAQRDLQLLSIPRVAFRPYVQRLPRLRENIMALIDSRAPSASNLVAH
jgi:diguanylate cyclase (GGDEF)-like protein